MYLQWSTLPVLLKLYIILNVIFLLIILIFNWKAFLFMPLFYIPIVLIYYYWKNNYHDINFELISNLYVLSNSLGMIIVMIIQYVIVIIIGMICFGSKKFFELIEQVQSPNFKSYKDIKNLQVDKNFGYYFFIFLLSFLIGGVVEETLKYIMVDQVKRKIGINYQMIVDYQIYAITVSLGFSTMENLAYQLFTGWSSDSTVLNLFIIAIQRIAIGTPGHCLYGYLTGLRIIRRDIFKQSLSFFDIIKWSVFLHGNSNFWIFMIAAHNIGFSSSGLEMLTVIFTGIVAYLIVKRERKIVAKLQ